MKKRGTSQVDWAISLALFLMYVIWFFIFVRPTFLQENIQESLINIVEDNFKDDYKWTVNKLPIMIHTNITNAYEPIVLDFPYSWEQNNSRLDDSKEFVFDNGKIIFLGALENKTKIFWVINSNENYTSKSSLKDLNANSTLATTGQNLKIEFENNLYKRISYRDKMRLNNTIIYIEDDPIEMVSNFSNISDSVGIYRIISQGANHTSYIFPKNSVIYNYVNLNMNGSYTLRIYVDLYDYKNYYATNNYYGYINYSYPRCEAFNNDYITFYDQNSITFNFNRSATIRFCYSNDTINFNVSLSLGNETYYKIYFHDGDYNNITLKRYEVDFGAIEKEKGLYLEKIEGIDYATLKNNWNYPKTRDFRITIWNTTAADITNRTTQTIKDIGASLEDVKDIAVTEWDDYILTKEANLYKAVVNIKTW